MSAELLMSQDAVAADRTRWLAVRRGGVTASEIAAIIGIEPKTHDGAFAVYVAKTAGEEFVPDNDAMMRGRHLEPYVAERYADEYPPMDLRPGGLYRSAERPWQMATYDRLGAPDGTGSDWTVPVQIKTANSRFDSDGKLIWGDHGSDHIPVWYRAQCLQEMDVWDADRVLIPCLFMGTWSLSVYEIVRDKAAEHDIAVLREAGEAFMERIATGTAPPIDWTPATRRALLTLNPDVTEREVRVNARLARRYRKAQRAVKLAHQRLGQATNELMAAMGDGKYAVARIDGKPVKIATRTQSSRKTVDTKALRARKPRIAKQFTKETPVDALYPSTWAKADKDADS